MEKRQYLHMKPTERNIHSKIESLEEERSGPRDSDDETPLAVYLGPPRGLPEPEHGTGIQEFRTAETAEAALGEEFWEDPTIKIWDLRDESKRYPDEASAHSSDDESTECPDAESGRSSNDESEQTPHR